MSKYIIKNRTDRVEQKWTVREMVDNVDMGTAIFDNAVQRGIVWDAERNSKLIRSIILNDPIPPFYASKYGSIYSFIDGKQRALSSLHRFLNDEFALSDCDSGNLEPIMLYNRETEEETELLLDGKFFSDLDEDIQELIKGYSLTICVLNDPSEEKECEVFYNLNNGKAMDTTTRLRATCKARKDLVDLGKHKLFTSALTEKAFAKYVNENIVVKSWAMLHEEEPCMDASAIKKVMEGLEFSVEDKVQLEECFDRILRVHNLIEDKKVARKIFVRTHLTSIMRAVWKSIESKMSDQEFAEWFITFFVPGNKPTCSKIYNDASSSGSGKKESVRKRLQEIDNSFNEFFANKSDVNAA